MLVSNTGRCSLELDDESADRTHAAPRLGRPLTLGYTKQVSPTETAAERLALAFELFAAGVSIKREQLRRQYPDATDEQLAVLLGNWLRSRPAAPVGDSPGRRRPAR